MKKQIIAIILMSSVLLAACQPKVDTHKINDEQMTCNQIIQEINEVHKVKQEVDDSTGMSGRNVGLAIFFWPGVIVNEVQASDAIQAADKRIEVLNDLYKKRKCGKSYSAGSK